MCDPFFGAESAENAHIRDIEGRRLIDFASEAMQAAGFVWDAQKLDEFLVSPIAVVVGTKMGFAGFQEPKDRADLIAYLWQFNHDPASCPSQK